jgi:hypothetical protein
MISTTVTASLIFFVSAISNQTFAQENDDIYEGLGIKIKYFDPWTILTSSDESNCYTKDFCMLMLGIDNGQGMGQIWITQDRENSPKIKYQCKCDTLKDYVRYVYTNTIFQFYNFSFINDNQTIISENRSAIQLEYELSLDDIQVHALTIFTKNNDSYYHFTYYAIPQTFSKYLDDFKKIINSLEFVSTSTESKKKQPSFMSKVEEISNNNSTLIFIDENEEPQDLLNSDNKKQKQHQEKQQQEQVLKQQQQQQKQQQVLKQQQEQVLKQQQQQQQQQKQQRQ